MLLITWHLSSAPPPAQRMCLCAHRQNCDVYYYFFLFRRHVERMKNSLPISLLHVPSIIFSSIRKICRPGKLFAHPLPVKSRNTDAWLYGLYSYACVPLPALKPIYGGEFYISIYSITMEPSQWQRRNRVFFLLLLLLVRCIWSLSACPYIRKCVRVWVTHTGPIHTSQIDMYAQQTFYGHFVYLISAAQTSHTR